MRKTVSACALAAVLLVLLSVSMPSTASSPAASYPLPYRVSPAPSRPDLEAQLVILLNHDRVRAGLAALASSAPLRAAARGHGVDLFAGGYLSHTARNGSTPITRAQAAGVHAQIVGENLAYAPDIQTAHRLLMGSPRHRANILSRRYHWVGIGVLDGGAKGLIVVEVFTD